MRPGSYLPASSDPVQGKVLEMRDAHPADHRSLPELACTANTSERTLTRRCQRDVGTTINEGRPRQREIKAMALLEAGDTVESITLGLGYSTSSAFITMFRRLAGETPDEYRRGGGHAAVFQARSYPISRPLAASASFSRNVCSSAIPSLNDAAVPNT